ncbi:MAG: hypothetical protein QHH27_09590 [Clostridia bacterium]|nr:hypothetical protein [Clostridia bacterium]MDH7573783.1 hypothetical protein [Clostridia bacterium]
MAVGNRSMFMHVAGGTHLSVECFARMLYNHGVMAVVDRDRARWPEPADLDAGKGKEE